MEHKDNILKITKEQIKKELQKNDETTLTLSKISNGLTKNINELYETFRIISDLEYPTLNELVSIKEYCEIYLLETINETTLTKIRIDKKIIPEILKITNADIGITLDKKNKQNYINLCKTFLNLIELKEDITNNLNEHIKKNYPNLYKTAGTEITCKILEITGSLEKLSKLPAGTIQLLGAEKSLFKALRYKKKTPKYGYLYNHPLIINTKQKNKAKMARTLATTISLAAKADYYKKDISESLEKKIQKRQKGAGAETGRH